LSWLGWSVDLSSGVPTGRESSFTSRGRISAFLFVDVISSRSMLQKDVVHPTAHAQEDLAKDRDMMPMFGIDGDLRDDAPR
jgi:hypothetical protein